MKIYIKTVIVTDEYKIKDFETDAEILIYLIGAGNQVGKALEIKEIDEHSDSITLK